MIDALSTHWPEYLIEGSLLGVFMFIACGVVVLIEHPASPVRRAMPLGTARRVIIGLLMGLTAIALIFSPLGRRSGAHMNPATTLTFLALGKVRMWDAAFYVLAQFLGGLIGVMVARRVLGRSVAHERVRYAATRPGARGRGFAWAGEFTIAFIMMSMVLITSNRSDLAPYTGIFAGALVALFIIFEAPLSGMSLNPARSLASALPARTLTALWIYFTAPPLGMLAAAGVYVGVSGLGNVHCAKLDHRGHSRCIFNCRAHEVH